MKGNTKRNPCSGVHGRWSIAFMALVFFPQFADAQVMPLDSVLSAIQKRNPMLQRYQHRATAMNDFAEGATALMAPEVGGGLWMVPYKTPMEERDKGQIMLSVQQKFPSRAKLTANKNLYNSRADIERTNESFAFNELRAQARTAYYQWMVLKEKKKVLNESERIISLMLKLAQLRYPYNQGKLGNIYKAEGRLQEIKNMQLMNESGMTQKNILLNRLMNLPQDARWDIDSTTQVMPVTDQVPDTLTLAETRSDIRSIDKAIQSVRLNQEVERSQTKPDFNISFNHMIPRSLSMPSQFMLLGMVSIPIAPWSSKMYKANVKGMDAEIASMKKEREAILNEAVGMTAAMAAEIQSTKKQLDNYNEKIIPALRRNFETLMVAYEENKEELPIVIDGWEALNMARLEYLNKLEDYYTLMVSYEKEIEK